MAAPPNRKSTPTRPVLLRTGVADDLVAPGEKGGDPLIDGPVAITVLRLAPAAVGQVGHLEEAADLVVGQLPEKVGQESPPGLADHGMLERGMHDVPWQLRPAPPGILPQRHPRPFVVG